MPPEPAKFSIRTRLESAAAQVFPTHAITLVAAGPAGGPTDANPLLITAKKDLPPTNLKELVAWLKANPGKVTLGDVGAGSPPHIAGVFFEKLTGTEIQFVPYRGGGPAMQDLIAGHIDLNMGQVAVAIPQVNAGTVKAYAVTAESRIAAAPSIPTTDEAGVPGLHLSVWHGLWVPKSTPKEIVVKLNAAVVDALADPAACPTRSGHSTARATNSGSARCISEGGDRKVVADYQGGGHQGRMTLSVPDCCGA
jgi:tripartite-type tricarboxylate transporter receptor subunit TctC